MMQKKQWCEKNKNNDNTRNNLIANPMKNVWYKPEQENDITSSSRHNTNNTNEVTTTNWRISTTSTISISINCRW